MKLYKCIDPNCNELLTLDKMELSQRCKKCHDAMWKRIMKDIKLVPKNKVIKSKAEKNANKHGYTITAKPKTLKQALMSMINKGYDTPPDLMAKVESELRDMLISGEILLDSNRRLKVIKSEKEK